MAAQAEEESRRRDALRVAGLIFAAAVAVAAVVVLTVFLARKFPREGPRYSMAVTAVAGLDPARDLSERGRPTLSPVLNVKVRIDNTRNAIDSECIYGVVTAAVSYGDAFLGKGTVPQLCVHQRRQAEVVVRAWGQDVVVPWFLWDELAAELAVGEATVAVQLMPGNTVCKAKIGGGLSPCGPPE